LLVCRNPKFVRERGREGKNFLRKSFRGAGRVKDCPLSGGSVTRKEAEAWIVASHGRPEDGFHE